MTAYQHADRLWGNLLELGTKRLLALAAIGIAVIVSVVAGAYYLGRPQMAVLYSGLEREDVSRIGSALTDSGIEFDVSAAGDAVLVRPAQTARARMLLAEKGLPFSSNSGYELFDNLGSLGITSFMQEVTRVRALEGEVARTIQQMRGIVAARVHIVLSDPGSFRREAREPSASVVVRAETADIAGQAQAIRHLVAAAVPGMKVDGVTVLSADGTLLASGDDAAGAATGRITSLNREVNRELEDAVRRTLTPYLGLENFQISVAARINTDRRVVSETIFDPDGRVERSVRIVRENEAATNLSRQTPVTVEQNLPEEEVAADGGEQSSEETQRREELTNYEISSRQVQVSSDGFAIEQLSLAVLVNRARLAAALGPDATPEALDAEIAEIEALAASAAGFDAARGDTIKVSAVNFLSEATDLEPVPAATLKDALLAQAGTIVNALAILLVALTLVWFGLKPALAAILDRPKPAAIEETEIAALENGAAGEEDGERAVPALPHTSGAEPHMAQIEAATAAIAALPTSVSKATIRRLEQIVTKNEEQAAHVLKQWMHAENACDMPASLHDVLAEIGFPTDTPRLPPPQAAGRGDAERPAEPEVTPAFGPRPQRPEEIEAQVSQAYARGAAEAREAAESALAEALIAARAEAAAAHEASLAEARATWAAETADRLAGLLAEGIGAIEERLSEAAARALAPLLRSAARDRALEGLAEAVATLLRAEPALTLSMRGPADLGEALLARLGDVGAAIRFTPADTPDLHVEGADTRIETRLADWARRIEADAA